MAKSVQDLEDLVLGITNDDEAESEPKEETSETSLPTVPLPEPEELPGSNLVGNPLKESEEEESEPASTSSEDFGEFLKKPKKDKKKKKHINWDDDDDFEDIDVDEDGDADDTDDIDLSRLSKALGDFSDDDFDADELEDFSEDD